MEVVLILSDRLFEPGRPNLRVHEHDTRAAEDHWLKAASFKDARRMLSSLRWSELRMRLASSTSGFHHRPSFDGRVEKVLSEATEDQEV